TPIKTHTEQSPTTTTDKSTTGQPTAMSATQNGGFIRAEAVNATPENTTVSNLSEIEDTSGIVTLAVETASDEGYFYESLDQARLDQVAADLEDVPESKEDAPPARYVSYQNQTVKITILQYE
ncbi:hypothetical protein, partial [Haloferax profundi]